MNETQAEGLAMKWTQGQELPKESPQAEELPRESQNYHYIIISIFIFIIILVSCFILLKKRIKKDSINPSQKNGESSRLEMPNVRLLNADWNQEETQIAEQDALSVIPFLKLQENQEK